MAIMMTATKKMTMIVLMARMTEPKSSSRETMIMMTVTKMMLLIVLIFRLTEPRSSW